MTEQFVPQRLQDAQIELETSRRLWETTEEQITSLVDALVHRIKEEEFPFWEHMDEDSILQRDRVTASMLRIARANALIQAWVIFEESLDWASDELRRQGRRIEKRLPGENLVTWAERTLSLCATSPWRDEVLDGLGLLSRLRNMLVHTNGRLSQMRPGDRELVNQLSGGTRGIAHLDDRLEVRPNFITTMFRIASMAIFGLSRLFHRSQPGP